MASQPANTQIKVFRTLRSYRRAERQESIAALTKRLRPLIMSIPNNEDKVSVITRDPNVEDLSSYMGEARHNARRGQPVVVGIRSQVSFSNAINNIPGVGLSFQIGQDQFITNSQDELQRDLFDDARAVVPN